MIAHASACAHACSAPCFADRRALRSLFAGGAAAEPPKAAPPREEAGGCGIRISPSEVRTADLRHARVAGWRRKESLRQKPGFDGEGPQGLLACGGVEAGLAGDWRKARVLGRVSAFGSQPKHLGSVGGARPPLICSRAHTRAHEERRAPTTRWACFSRGTRQQPGRLLRNLSGPAHKIATSFSREYRNIGRSTPLPSNTPETEPRSGRAVRPYVASWSLSQPTWLTPSPHSRIRMCASLARGCAVLLTCSAAKWSFDVSGASTSP